MAEGEIANRNEANRQTVAPSWRRNIAGKITRTVPRTTVANRAVASLAPNSKKVKVLRVSSRGLYEPLESWSP